MACGLQGVGQKLRVAERLGSIHIDDLVRVNYIARPIADDHVLTFARICRCVPPLQAGGKACRRIY